MNPSSPATDQPTLFVAECDVIVAYLRALLEGCGYRVVSATPENAGPLFAAAGRVDVVITNKPALCLRFGVPVIYIASQPDPALACHDPS